LPALFRRREVWLPTWRGVLLLLIVAAAVVVALAINAYALLAPNQPATGRPGVGARTLVVEGWLDQAELQQAVVAVRTGHYDRVLTTGGPIASWTEGVEWIDSAARVAEYLRKSGVAGVPVISVPAPLSAQDRSYLSAVMVREWAQRSGVALESVDVFTAGVHARRSWLVYRIALGDEVEVGVLAARPTEYDVRWWTSSAGTKATLGETLSLAWTKCCFWPAY
jgi:hypothetical protein